MNLPNPVEAVERACSRLVGEDRLALLLDLDGTLIPFAATTEAATLDPVACELLAALHASRIDVVIVTGRPRTLVEPMCELARNAKWVAEHGAWRCAVPDEWTGPPAAAEIDEVARVLTPFTLVPGARLERKSLSLCLHWRLVAPAEKAELIAAAELACDEWLEAHPDFERLDGVEMLEVRRSSANKRVAVEWVREHMPGARMIAIGDDRTDEDMFAALGPDDLAIGVGVSRAHTACWLPGPPAVRAFLRWLSAARMDGVSQSFDLFRYPPAVPPPPPAPLVVVSNRIPSAATGRERSVGGLVSALEPALRSAGGVWVGWNGEESPGDRRLEVDAGAEPMRASFAFPPQWRERFYGGFCNRALWPLFHGFPGRVQYSDADWLAYVAANAEFAQHARELVAHGGTVWIHDYHLLLAGRALRQRGFSGPLGLFLHIPFPQRDLFQTLPWADEIVAAMLDFDLIGFHTEQWAENFRACAAGSAITTELAVLPIGIDADRFAPAPGAADAEIANLRAALGDRRLILGVDRLDYAKGIPERLLGFERLLENQPEWRGRAVFVQISVPSRADVPEYAELRQRVEHLVGRINGHFGEADWVPVRYLYRSYDHRILAQLYRAADVALVTPLRDGLNLVAKEFVAAQDPQHPGVLVLSRFAGAAAELHDALITNPFHPDGLAGDIDRALRMPLDERVRRHARLTSAIAGKTPARWAAAFLDRLHSVRAA